MLALTQSAEAKIIFTAAKIAIPTDSTVTIDLNHDGIADFSFSFYSRTSAKRGGIRGEARPPASVGVFGLMAAPAQPGNAIGAITSFTRSQFAAELPPGHVVSSFRNFVSSRLKMNRLVFTFNAEGSVQGPWQNDGGYLGLKFVVSGETYYGWAHITIPSGNIFGTCYITGYAFEDTPNTPIKTGDRSGPANGSLKPRPSALPMPAPAPTLQPATLGHLAKGSLALPLWRRPEETGEPETRQLP